MGNVVGCDRIAHYIGASGRASVWPLRAGQEAPASVTMPSGEVRPLVMVSYVETEQEPDLTLGMEVAA